MLRTWIERCALIAALASLPYVLDEYTLGLATEVLILGLLVASLDLLAGYTGLVSIGHAAFFGVGGYAAGLLGTQLGMSNAVLVLLAAAGLAALGAVVIGWFCSATKGVTFIMLTIAFGEIVAVIALTWRSLTKGDDGIAGVPVATMDPLLDVDLGNPVTFYWYALIVFVIGMAVLSRIVASPFGWALRGARSNAERMTALGYWVRGYKLAAFVIAGAVAGLAGGLQVQDTGFVSPALLAFTFSALAIVMHKIGGSQTLYGPVIGAAIVVYFRDELSSLFPDQWQIALGVVFILAVYLLPDGVAAPIQRLRRRLGLGERAFTPRRAAVAGEPDKAAPVVMGTARSEEDRA